jgi:hypothetical protein
LKIFQNIEPTLRCRPDFVQGMPVARDTLRLALVTPTARFQLKPPLFIRFPLLLLSNVLAVMHGHYGNGISDRAVLVKRKGLLTLQVLSAGVVDCGRADEEPGSTWSARLDERR